MNYIFKIIQNLETILHFNVNNAIMEIYLIRRYVKNYPKF